MIQITIPDADLKNATVFQALTTLVAALGPRKPGRPPGSGAKPAAAPAAAPARRGRPPKAAVAAPQKRAYRRSATTGVAKAAHASKPRGEKPSPEAWSKFVDGLRPQQKKFLALLEGRRNLLASDAMKEMGVPSSSLGGIVGALLRWAPARGIRLPFTAGKNEAGEKNWVWEG